MPTVFAVLALAALAIAGSAPAAAHYYDLPPVVTKAPVIAGEPVIGTTLRAQGATWEPPEAQRVWTWQRCDDEGKNCANIPTATTDEWVLNRDDHGVRVRVRLVVRHGGVTSQPAFSEPTAVVTSPPIADIEPGWTGTARAGETLTRDEGVWWGTEPIDLASAWLRCGPEGFDCEFLPASDTPTYAIGAADVGHALRVWTLATNPAGQTAAMSPPTAAVAAAEQPADPGGSFSDPGPVPQADPVPATDPAPSPPAAEPPIAQPSLMDPFPVIRISGRFTRTHTVFTRISVRAPRGARISVRCRGRGCPRTRKARSSRVRRLRRYERTLRPRAVLVIRVTRRGYIGKHTRIRVRRGAAPARRDRCLLPGRRKPVRCPAGTA